VRLRKTILDSVVVKVDTVIITQKQVVRDTLVLKTIDTLKLIKEGVRIDIRRSYDTIQVDVECPSDTIRISKEVRVPQVIYREKEFNAKHLWLLIISIILYTLLLLKYVK
jgi:hypothetical protein